MYQKQTVILFLYKNHRYLKANDLTNELEVKKDKMIESYQRRREQLIEDGLAKIHQLQNEEKKQFNNKIEQLRRDFYKKHYEKYNQAEKKLEDTLKDFIDANQIENANFDRIMNETKKQGIYLSPKMQEQTLKYIEYTKQKKYYGYSDEDRYNSSLNI